MQVWVILCLNANLITNLIFLILFIFFVLIIFHLLGLLSRCMLFNFFYRVSIFFFTINPFNFILKYDRALPLDL